METTTLKTKQVAAQFKIKPVQLRRVLRSMKRYADGVHTNYRWTLPGDEKVIAEIGTAIALRAKEAAERKAAAQSALAEAKQAAK